MKKVTVFLSIMLLLGILFTGCSNSQNSQIDSTQSTNGTTDPATEPVTEPVTQPTEEPRTLTLGGVDISQYKIVYALNEEKAHVYGVSRNYWHNDYDCERQTAKRLVEMIQTYFGVEIEMGLDIYTEASEYEILIGATNREESQTAATTPLDIDHYEVKLYGTRLVISGGAQGSMYHALDGLEAWFKSEVDGNAYDLTTSAPITGSYQLKRIAFIGDSITEGYSASDRQYLSYVANVARMNWQECVVYNYGRSSKTMRSDLADSYQSCAQWSQCLANNEQYDIVLIMLGTNDSNRDKDWTTDDDKVYQSSCRQIIDRAKEHSPNAEFVIMNCPAYYGTGNYGSARVRKLQSEIVDTLQAEGYPIHFYDMYTYTSLNLGEEMFPDLLHPNDLGHLNMAKGITEMLKLLAEGKTNQYLLK